MYRDIQLDYEVLNSLPEDGEVQAGFLGELPSHENVNVNVDLAANLNPNPNENENENQPVPAPDLLETNAHNITLAPMQILESLKTLPFNMAAPLLRTKAKVCPWIQQSSILAMWSFPLGSHVWRSQN